MDNSNKHKRPQNISDLDILWAIRDIPKSILCNTQKGILCMLLACIGNNSSCYYNMDQLINILGLSLTPMRNQLHELEDRMFIKITRPAKYYRGAANEYSLNYELILSTGKHFREQQEGC